MRSHIRAVSLILLSNRSMVTYNVQIMRVGRWVADDGSATSYVLFCFNYFFPCSFCSARREARIVPHCGFILTMRLESFSVFSELPQNHWWVWNLPQIALWLIHRQGKRQILLKFYVLLWQPELKNWCQKCWFINYIKMRLDSRK